MTHGSVVTIVFVVMNIASGLSNKNIYLAYLLLSHIIELEAEMR